MADISIKALYASVVEEDEDNMLFVGFAQGEDEEEPYVLFRQSLDGGPIWFEVSDEDLGADDAVTELRLTREGLEIDLQGDLVQKLGLVHTFLVKIGPATEDADLAIDALRQMYGPLFKDA